MWRIIDAIARLTFLDLARNRLVWLLALSLLGALGLAEFLSRIALTETAAFQLAVLAPALRLAGVVLVALFVTSSLAREMNDKGLEMQLALPVGRSVVLAGKLIGFGAGAVVMAVLFALAAMLHAPVLQAAIWGVSLAAELWIVTAVSVLAMLTFAQVPAAMAAVLAFYLLARGVAALKLMGHGPMVFDAGALHGFAVTFVDALAWLLPALHQFTRTEWLTYPGAGLADLVPVLAQSAVYLVLLTAAAAFDLHRRNF